MKPSRAQAYYVPDLKMLIKVEVVCTKLRVAGFPTGPERIHQHQMQREMWIHKGEWKNEYEHQSK